MSAHRGSRAQRRPRARPRQQRGIALLVAILLVALGTIIAAAVAYENAMTARRGAATYAFDQALLVGAGRRGARRLRPAPDRAALRCRSTSTSARVGTSPWADRGGARSDARPPRLEDLQGRFNLNNLVRPERHARPGAASPPSAAAAIVGLEPKWAGYIVDWIDTDIVPQHPRRRRGQCLHGADPALPHANRYITSTSELLALPGFGHDRYVKLAPYVTRCPTARTINVCTASGVVLDAFLGAGHTEFSSDPEALGKNRASDRRLLPDANYRASRRGVDHGGGTAGGRARNPAATGGQRPLVRPDLQYFRLTSFITIGSTEFNLYSLLYQDRTGAVRPIQRSFTPD